MALTITKTGNFINVVFDGATAWDPSAEGGMGATGTILPVGVKVKSVQMVPAAASNTLTLRTGGSSGVVITKWTASSVAADAVSSSFIKYFTSLMLQKLYVVGNEATTGVLLIIET